MDTMFVCAMFDGVDLDGVGTAVFVVLLVVMAGAAALVNIVPRLLHRWEITYRTRDITYGAICLAMSFALSFAKPFRLPQGGSVTLAALAPIFVYCYYFGLRKGMIVTAAYTALQLLQDPFIISPWSAFFDYILPCFSLCVVGLFPYRPDKYAAFVKKSGDRSDGGRAVKRWAYTLGGHWGIFVGVGIHTVIRYLSSVLSGILFFGEYAPAEYGAVVWGFLYNTVLIVDSAVALLATVLLMSSRTFNFYMSAAFADKPSDAEPSSAVPPDEPTDTGDTVEPTADALPEAEPPESRSTSDGEQSGDR